MIGSIVIINGVGVIGIGIFSLLKTWYRIFTIGVGTSEHVGAYIFKSIDVILVGIVFFIFGISLKTLIKKQKVSTKNDSVAEIFDIEGFLHQKHFLWQALATTLLFVFVTHIFKSDEPTWDLLIVPCGLALVTLSMFFMKKSH